MSEQQSHPPMLDTALHSAEQAGHRIVDVYQDFESAAKETENLDRWLNTAVGAVHATATLIEQHAAAYDTAQELAEQAIQKHDTQDYGPNNTPAIRAGVRLRHGRENMNTEKEILLGMAQVLLGGAEQLGKVRGDVHRALTSLDVGIMICKAVAAGQGGIIAGIRKYISDRDKETGVGKNVEVQFILAEQATQTVSHTEEPAELAEKIANTTAPLVEQRRVLAKVEQALQQIDEITKKMDLAMRHWLSYAPMPGALPGLHGDLMEMANNLGLPFTAEMLNDHIRRLTLQQKNFEAAQTNVDESRGLIDTGKQLIASAISALRRYLLRGY